MYVVTFYSFKGGVGRTLALLNVAYEIANSGQHVLVVDFDLEAPAIRPDRWKQGANDDETDQVGHCAKIHRLFHGEDVTPVFMRACEPSGEPG